MPLLTLLVPLALAAAGDTAPLQKALDAASASGGGEVVLEARRYTVGTIHLRSHVTLRIPSGAVLAMSTDDSDFDGYEPASPIAGADKETGFFRRSLLAGERVEDVAIVGAGRIDCQRTRRGGPKPVGLRECRRVTIRGVTIENAPNYAISLLGCDYVTIDGVNIRNGWADGIDPDCSHFVRISNSFVESVDDAICLKASTALGRRAVTEDVTVTNCVLRTASIHFKMGTESYGDFRNITVNNCTFVGGMGNRHGNPGLALETVDGGSIQGVTISNITMRDVGIPIFLRLGERGRGQVSPAPGRLEDISISNVVATGARRTCVIAGIPGALIRNWNSRAAFRATFRRIFRKRALIIPIPRCLVCCPPTRSSRGMRRRSLSAM
ncbi:MAG: glycosyl hydrolase family 28 protein [Acidobacteria bacterium]|nr:glycosyl hydrolase family 28 protein [Acidobacteriota bacterium]